MTGVTNDGDHPGLRQPTCAREYQLLEGNLTNLASQSLSKRGGAQLTIQRLELYRLRHRSAYGNLSWTGVV